MSLADLKSQLPDYAKDLRLNLDSVLSEGGAPGLTQKQIMVVALAAAIASRYKPLTKAVAEEAAQHASAEELNGARVAASIMGMNTIYYRFVHLVSEPEYGTLRAGLRMNAMMNPGGTKIDFELASLAVAAVNGCGMCVDSHEKTLRKHGLSAQPIQSAIRIAAVVHAVAVALEQADVAG
ncbi:carboxymuconolactone decarboxylase family protein [Frateuria sp. MAH-13]|uniref:Alkyl hydroperoxide reductase AhpD n=1 Tax=Frateuria flava TaxID=2821489 RepID=A0ABS4DKG5_9GAMM|nr:carboxymuconolactone decarboxylase family protein [Frateuria flava]MBP1473543.1 carboxymuconolactone decarboxylase family protein [Frateuria flava]